MDAVCYHIVAVELTRREVREGEGRPGEEVFAPHQRDRAFDLPALQLRQLVPGGGPGFGRRLESLADRVDGRSAARGHRLFPRQFRVPPAGRDGAVAAAVGEGERPRRDFRRRERRRAAQIRLRRGDDERPVLDAEAQPRFGAQTPQQVKIALVALRDRPVDKRHADGFAGAALFRRDPGRDVRQRDILPLPAAFYLARALAEVGRLGRDRHRGRSPAARQFDRDLVDDETAEEAQPRLLPADPRRHGIAPAGHRESRRVEQREGNAVGVVLLVIVVNE